MAEITSSSIAQLEIEGHAEGIALWDNVLHAAYFDKCILVIILAFYA